MLEETQDDEEIIERVAALDIGKAELVCCVRVPGSQGRAAGAGGDDLHDDDPVAAGAGRAAAELGVTRVVMEATSDYWKPPFYLLEAHGFEIVAGQRQGRQAPAGPAEDRPAGRGVAVQGRRAADAPAQLRAAPADPAAAGSDPLPGDLVAVRTAEKNRVEKLLEDAQIKLSVVASRHLRGLGRAMMAALIAGQRDPQGAGAAGPARMRAKIRQLEEAFIGRFSEHHAFLLAKMLAAHRRDQRRHRRGRRPDRGRDRPFR